MKKRVKKGFTSKQIYKIRNITIIIAFILGILYCASLILNRFFEKNLDMFIIACISCFIVLPGCICILFSLWGRITQYEEYQEKQKAICKEILSKEKFTKVIFFHQEEDKLLSYFENTGCIFLAKFDDEDNIILIVKDKEMKEVHREKISNYAFFNARFKKKEP